MCYISKVTLLIALLITTHEPPSRPETPFDSRAWTTRLYFDRL